MKCHGSAHDERHLRTRATHRPGEEPDRGGPPPAPRWRLGVGRPARLPGFAQLAIDWEAMKYTRMRSLTRQLRGEPPGLEGLILKVCGSALGLRIAVLTARQYTISAGTSEIQRNIIGERVLGLLGKYEAGRSDLSAVLSKVPFGLGRELGQHLAEDSFRKYLNPCPKYARRRRHELIHPGGERVVCSVGEHNVVVASGIFWDFNPILSLENCVGRRRCLQGDRHRTTTVDGFAVTLTRRTIRCLLD